MTKTIETFERNLTATDWDLLASYKQKTQGVKDLTLAVLKGTHTGLLLFGSGGNGKSYSVRETLTERGMREITPMEAQAAQEGEEPKIFGFDTFIVHQGRVTPKGLVKEMAAFPNSLHLVEDAETMFDDKNCWGVLRMALHSQDHNLHSTRRITWKISTNDSYDFHFQGGLLIVGNRLLNDSLEEVKAVQTRCPCVNFDISNSELIAKMKELCERGYGGIGAAKLSKEDCYDVLEFILSTLDEDAKLKAKKLNLRILISGFRFLALGKLEASINWKEMLSGQLRQTVEESKRSREERICDEKKLAKEFEATNKVKGLKGHAKLVEWCRIAGRPLDWSNQPKDSKEYIAGSRAAKQDLYNKSK
jgi:hypothetical protein